MDDHTEVPAQRVLDSLASGETPTEPFGPSEASAIKDSLLAMGFYHESVDESKLELLQATLLNDHVHHWGQARASRGLMLWEGLVSNMLVFDNWVVPEQAADTERAMTISVVKTPDDWIWVLADTYEVTYSWQRMRPTWQWMGNHPSEISYQFSRRDTACWRCDQMRGLLRLLGSAKFALLASEWPGNYSRRRD